MDERKKTGSAATAVAFTVVVAGTGVGACSDEVVVHDGTGGAGGTGTTATGTTTGTTTTTGTPSGTTTTTTGHTECDPACVGTWCPTSEQLQATGAIANGQLTMTVELGQYFEPYCLVDWASDPVVVVAPGLGTLVSATANMDGTVEIVIALTNGTAGGTVSVDLEPVLEQPIDCFTSTTVNCPVDRVFDVTITGDGDVQIARGDPASAPALERRPPMKLVLVEGRGTDATVRVTGVPPDLPLRFGVTAGAVRVEGATALWHLPERPGWYQIEAVAERDGLLATDALIVEVRRSSTRS